VHYKRLAMVGLLFSILCIGLLALVAGHASLLVVEVLTVCIGIGSGTTFPVATLSVQNAVDQAHLGVATGVLTFLRSLGSAFGVAMLGAVALGYGLPLAGEGTLAVGQLIAPTPFVMIFLVAGATLFLAFVALWLMPEKELRGRAEHAPVIAD
jgi:MFS family permease